MSAPAAALLALKVIAATVGFCAASGVLLFIAGGAIAERRRRGK